MDGANNNNVDNSTDSRYQRLSGERVAILCESGNPHQEYVWFEVLCLLHERRFSVIY